VTPVARRSDDHVHNTISCGIHFSAVIQGRDITVVLPPEITPAMAGLPAASASFTGRSPDLDKLLQMLAPRHAGEGTDGTGTPSGAGPALVTAVGGMGGIGKTELAVQAARIAVSRGWFPGGVLFEDMFGYDRDRCRTAAQAASGFVRALGIPGEHIPDDAQELSRLLQSVLHAYAAEGHPVLMVVDNVSAKDQASPLLPAHTACRAIVTSRHTLGLLGARLIDLDILDTSQAVGLLDRAIQVARPGDRRVTDHPADARAVAEACGGLPLALQIVAALLADNPGKPLAAMVTDLADPASRLAELSYGGDALTTVFDLSYQQLPAGQARLFRLLPVNPGPDIATTAAAALAGLPEAETRRGLEALARAHLIEPGSAYGRWRMHDLIRLHSTHHGYNRAGADQRPEALTRLLGYYLATTRTANAHLDPIVADPASLGFPTREQALAWLDAEYANLTAAAHTAAADPDHLTVARDLPYAMWDFLLWRRHFNDWITLSQIALTASQALHDLHGQVAALNSLGAALRATGRFEEAITAHQDAIQICQDTGNRRGEGGILINLGVALHGAGQFEEAITAHRDAIQICQDTGDRPGEGMALSNLGGSLREVGRFEEAITAHRDAIQICRDADDRHGEGQKLDSLGLDLYDAGRFEEAITTHQDAIQILHELGDRHGEGETLSNLGLALGKAGRFEEAITTHQDAIQILHELGDRQGEEIALNDLNETRQAQNSEPDTPEMNPRSTENAK
jgi:tetratricopeptide (TPR) repeat protein